jgi:hypothetical protein
MRPPFQGIPAARSSRQRAQRLLCTSATRCSPALVLGAPPCHLQRPGGSKAIP